MTKRFHGIVLHKFTAYLCGLKDDDNNATFFFFFSVLQSALRNHPKYYEMAKVSRKKASACVVPKTR